MERGQEKMTIYIRRINGWILIDDDAGNRMWYLYYSKRQALMKFKYEFGYARKRGIEIIDYTKNEPND